MTETAASNFPARRTSRPPARVWFVFVVLAALLAAAALGRGATTAPAAPPPPPGSRDLLAHGTEYQLWCADVVPGTDPNSPGPRTVIRARASGDAQWKVLCEIADRAVGLDNRGGELLVVLANGEWRIVSSDGDVRSGVPLPGGARVLAMAGGDEEDVWAVAAAPAGKMLDEPESPATSTATTTTSAAPAPAAAAATSRASAPTASTKSAPAATQPTFGPHDLALFHLVRGTWSEVALLPEGMRRGDLLNASIDVFERRVTVALAGQDRAVRVYGRTAGGWGDGRTVAALGEGGRMKLLEFEHRPVLWTSDARGPGKIAVDAGPKWGPPVNLAAPPALADYDRTALTAGVGRLLLLASDGRNRLAEQTYNLDGTTAGPPANAVTSPVAIDSRLAQTMQLVVMAVLLVSVAGAMRQRGNMTDAVRHVEDLQLAPLGRRLAGGAIDLLPILIGAMIGSALSSSGAQPLVSRLTIHSPEVACFAAGAGAYLLLTTVLELLLGRSIGKLLTGTRVAALDGSRPPPAAVLIRNLLRIVDLILWFPVVFVIFSPLRQRIGDMAAGTVVVRNDAPMPEPREKADEGE